MIAGPERALQAAVAQFLAIALPPDSFWSALPGGDGRMTRTPGYQPGLPDLMVAHAGKVILFELKAPGKYARANQRDAIHRLHLAGVPTHVVRSVEGVEEALRLAGVPLRATTSGKRLLEAAREKAA